MKLLNEVRQSLMQSELYETEIRIRPKRNPRRLMRVLMNSNRVRGLHKYVEEAFNPVTH